MLKRLIALILIILPGILEAQTVTGSWYGRADVSHDTRADNYLTELILKQKGNEVEGIFGYYFKDSYESFFIRGKYNPQTRVVEIHNLSILFYGADTRDGFECPMHFTGILKVSRLSSSLTGSFITDRKYRYTCPELTVTFTLDREADQDSIISLGATAQRQFWKPIRADYIVSNTYEKQEGKKEVPKVLFDSTEQVVSTRKAEELIKEFQARKNVVAKEIQIASDSIRLSFYDNGDIDGDTISVFLNNQPIVVSQGLTARALNVYIALDPDREVNEISMFADNLGTYPPNTALMIIYDGVNRHEIYLSSSLTQNAAIRLVRKKEE